MKKIILSILVSTSLSLNAQNVGINGDGTAPDSSAMLDVKAPDKGMLIPRVKLDDATTAAPVTNPKEGLLVYNETGAEAKGFWYWNGTEWVRLGSSEKGGGGVVGSIIPYGASTIPSGYLLCDGSAVSRTLYPDLFSVIGTNWGVGDGSTTFNLPDLRGRFMRGWDAATGNDPDAGSRIALYGGVIGDNVGSYQNDAFQNFTSLRNGSNILSWSGARTSAAPTNGYFGQQDVVMRNNPNTPYGNVNQIFYPYGARTSSETRPVNANVNYIIQYIPTVADSSIGGGGTSPQTLSIAGNNLSITNGNTVAIPQQTLSISGNDLSILNGNTITLPIPNAADSTRLTDADNDTKVQVEESVDEDIIRFDLAGIEKWVMTGNRLEPQNTLNGVFIGIGAGQANTASWNTGVGTHALTNSTGQHNTAIGADVLKTNTTGQLNTAIGVNSMILANGSKNTAVGHSTLANVTGNGNIGIGYTSGSNIITGNNNIAIGYDSEVPSQTADNQLSIGNLIYGTGLDGTGGTVSSGNIGIGEKVPTEKLHITNGSLKIDDGANPYTLPSADGTANQIMQTDGSGNVSWVNNSASSTVEAWKTPTFVNSWVNYESVNPGNNYSTAGYYIDRERVYLKGLLGNGAINSACFILPVGYRPNTRVLLSTISGSSTGRVDILPTGEVVIYSPSNSIWVSLEGLSFRINQ